MSKYVDHLLSIRPDQLIVFGEQPLSNIGYLPEAVSVTEQAGFAEYEPVPSLIPGEEFSAKFNVYHEYSTNLAAQYFAQADIGNYGEKLLGSTGIENWTVETVVKTDPIRRSRLADGGFVWGTSTLNGLSLVHVDETTRRFDFIVMYDDATSEVLSSQEFEVDQVHHVVVVKQQNYYSMYVDGGLEASGSTDETKTLDAGNDLLFGGVNSRYHSDSTIGLVAVFGKVLSHGEIVKNYSAFNVYTSPYVLASDKLEPFVSYYPVVQGFLTVEPEFDRVSNFAEHQSLFEESEVLSLADGLLAAAFSSQKQYEIDLTELSEGVSVYFDRTVSVPASSSLVSQYSTDGAAWSTLTEGQDTVPELDATWGSAT